MRGVARGGGVWLPRQMYSWTLVTPLCVGGSYVPPGTAVYLMDKPRLRAHRLPGHREARLGRSQWTLTLCPCSLGIRRGPMAPMGPCLPLPQRRPLPPGAASPPSLVWLCLIPSPPLPGATSHRKSQQLGSHMQKQAPRAAGGWGGQPPAQQVRAPRPNRDPTWAGSTELGPWSFQERPPQVGGGQGVSKTHACAPPMTPKPRTRRETLQRRLRLHQTLIRAPCGACSTATEGRPAQTFRMTQNLRLMG